MRKEEPLDLDPESDFDSRVKALGLQAGKIRAAVRGRTELDERDSKRTGKLEVLPPLPSETMKVREIIARLGELQCSLEEVALFLRMDVDQFREILRADADLMRDWQRAAAMGRIALRHILMWHARRPNGSGVAAAVALARQPTYLNFRTSGADSVGSLGGDNDHDALPKIDTSQCTEEELRVILDYRKLEQKLLAKPGTGGEGDRAKKNGNGSALLDAD